MCGRFALAKAKQVSKAIPTVVIRNGELFVARYNIAPSQPVAVVTNQSHELALYKWGLIPSWAKDEKVGYKMINARAETLAEKPSFRKALGKRRCLIPADGFYEWRKNPDDTKTPMYIRMKTGDVFAFAGLWETWLNPEGKEVRSCTIITTAPNDLMKTIHDRMPAIVPREGCLDWLKPEDMSANDAADWLKPYPAEEMEAYAVSTRVNSPGNEGPGLIEPASSSQLW